jgi:hypothetical protein
MLTFKKNAVLISAKLSKKILNRFNNRSIKDTWLIKILDFCKKETKINEFKSLEEFVIIDSVISDLSWDNFDVSEQSIKELKLLNYLTALLESTSLDFKVKIPDKREIPLWAYKKVCNTKGPPSAPVSKSANISSILYE